MNPLAPKNPGRATFLKLLAHGRPEDMQAFVTFNRLKVRQNYRIRTMTARELAAPLGFTTGYPPCQNATRK